MNPMRIAAAIIVAGLSVPAPAQLSAPVRNGESSDIVVTGRKEQGDRIEMSDWRVAETPHVIVFGKGPEKELAATALNLEKLHFLLSVLLNRVDAPDDAIKMRVTMIGDAADFAHLRLASARWQDGPYPREFPTQIYYDPREDGPVAATAGGDVKIILQQSLGRPTNPDCDAGGDDPMDMIVRTSSAMPPTGEGARAPDPTFPEVDVRSFPLGEVSICQSSIGRTYALFAQNYLLTYFPAAYPRWYLQGFGEMFATMAAPADNSIEYGRAPPNFRQVMEYYGRYPVEDVLSGRYLDDRRARPEWTPYHAWALVHLLFFSEEWRRPLHDYLAAVAGGRSEVKAAAALDAESLRRALGGYRGRKVPFERMTYPPERVGAPVIRRLTRSEAALVRGRLELGARIADAATPDGARRHADWLARLRDNAGRFPQQLDGQLLLAEAECRSGHAGECLAAADRALALAPSDATALLWKGEAIVALAAAEQGAERARGLKEGRALIVRANRTDPDALLPLTAYYRSFAVAGERASDAAVDGLIRTVESVPAAPAPRLDLGRELVARGDEAWARRTLLPVARGAFDSPERKDAEALLP